MDRHEVAAMLNRRSDCKSVDRAMAVVAQDYDLVAVWNGGTDRDWERVRREHSDARLVVLAKGRTIVDDRIGVFRPAGYIEPMLF
jgi:hypothetical protein